MLDEWTARSLESARSLEQARRLVYHGSVVLAHGLVVVLVFWLGIELGRAIRPAERGATLAAFLAGVFFAVHPINVESVAWMAGRSDVLCALFLLASLVFFLRARAGGWLAPALAGGFALLAMLAKEVGAAAVVLAPGLDLVAPPARGRLRRWGALLVAVLLYLALRYGAVRAGDPALAGIDVHALLGSIGWYALKATWPPPQSAFVPEVPGGAFVVVGAALGLAALGLAGRLWRRRLTGELFAVALFAAALVPALAIAGTGFSDAPLAERYLYVPSVGLCLLGGFVVERIASALGGGSRGARYTIATGLALVVAVPGAWATTQRAKIWRDDLVFWLAAVAQAPDHGLPHLNLGLAYADRDRVDEARRHYRLALERYADGEGRARVHINLGALLLDEGRNEEAIEAFRRALEEDPSNTLGQFNWGVAEYNLARQSQDPAQQAAHARNALERFRRALEGNPRYVRAHLGYGTALVSIGRFDEGSRHLRRVIELAPDSDAAERAEVWLELVAERGGP
jgi:tetratricopeptide (TPR) repeat protein